MSGSPHGVRGTWAPPRCAEIVIVDATAHTNTGPRSRDQAFMGASLPPVAGGDECGPVERMGTEMRGSPLAQHREPRLAHRGRGVELLLEARGVQRVHPRSRGAVVHWPKTHDHRPRAGDLKSAPQAEHAL